MKPLTRVGRKEPVTTAPVPYILVNSTIVSRPGSAQELKGLVGSQTCVVSHATTSTTPHLPITSSINPTPATSGSQSLVPSGPRRVPMPPPPPPAPVKEKLADTGKRPISRADTAPYSDQRPAVSAAPAEIPVVTITKYIFSPKPRSNYKG